MIKTTSEFNMYTISCNVWYRQCHKK